MGAGLG
jgi:hypothetical protein